MTSMDHLYDEGGAEALDLGIQELDEMVDPGFWDTAAGVAVGVVVGGAIVYGGAVLLAT